MYIYDTYVYCALTYKFFFYKGLMMVQMDRKIQLA